MSQVQVRQIPVGISGEAKRIVGSWFPTSYYGNFRAKSRADLAQYFRGLAQPVPPKRFHDRQTVEANAHAFSQHDNRFRFECDPLVRNTQSGFGRRKSGNNARGEFNPMLISWMPPNTDQKAFADSVKVTSYAVDYNRDSTPSRVLGEIQSINNTADNTTPPSLSSTASVYSCAYKHGQPDSERSKQVRQETSQRFLSTRTRLAAQKASKGSGGEGSVAACMVWNSAGGDNEPSTTTRPAPPPPSAPPKEERINIVVPITLQPRVIAENNNQTNRPHRQRAQSAGPRLGSSAPDPPSAPAQRFAPSPSMQMFQTTIASKERPRTATTTSREHYGGAHFGPRITDPRPVAPYEQTYSDRVQNLISKYM